MIHITLQDLGVQDMMTRLAKRTKDLSPVMRRIAGILHDAVEENFERQGRPAWVPLKPRTIRQRSRFGYWPGKILQRRGELAVSISRKFDARSAAVGTNRIYAAIHQFGGKAGRGHKVAIPARPFLAVTDQDLGEIRTAIQNYLTKGV
ncbi:MAG: phage virion morphogenesis protein [Syntrophaceae bacterium]|nr:phage virion morphogenesis protein [Syntrophaceae bacterium]